MNKKTHAILIIITVVFAIFYVIYQNSSPKSTVKSLPAQFSLGIVNDCRKTPAFINQLNMQQPAIDSKQHGHQGGLLIRDIINRQHIWQHDSWQLSGFIGGFDRDNTGQIYIAPLPYVSLEKNPPELQNQLYVIDKKSAQMSLFLKLPSTHLPNNKNPFGTMGLFYDCDTNSLYVSSVAGSTPKQQNGSIYQIDLTNNKIVSELNQTDTIGLGVFNTLKGKKLYYGSAREPHIYSVILDENGHFTDSIHYEFSLSGIKGGHSTLAKKISFDKFNNKYQMIIKETAFGFRLMAENNPNRKKYHFDYSIAQDKWRFSHTTQD